jgi:uncharacterized protein (TIGR02449 family)
MDAELASLEQKLSQLLDFCQRLRRENHALRQRLAKEQDRNKLLAERLEGARTRLSSLIERIPEG